MAAGSASPADPGAIAGPPALAASGVLAETAAIPWRRRASAGAIRRDGLRWTLWTAGVVAAFGAPAAVVVALEPLTAPFGALLAAHGAAVLNIQAGRGAQAVVPVGSKRSVAKRVGATSGPERVAMGLLGDLLGHQQRELLSSAGLAPHRGELGEWLVGEQGAIMVRPGGRRVDCWCVRVAEPGDLPAPDRVAHLLLALREDERGFATVANFNFSGAPWRIRMRMPARSRPALDAARRSARERG